MKKAAATFIFLIIIIFSLSEGYSENQALLFYNGKVYSAHEGILSYDNENFIDAGQLADILGIKYTVDKAANSMSIEFNGIKSIFQINSFEYSNTTLNYYKHNSPEYISNKLFFPFSFVKEVFKLAIKYNKDKGNIYILPAGTIDRSSLQTFINTTYDYSLLIPDRVELNIDETDSGLQDSTISLIDKDNRFVATITCDNLDDSALKSMRGYLNDYTSKDEEIFQKFAEYKKSYFRAIQDSYRKDFLYGSSHKGDSGESNMKIFTESSEKLFGQNAQTVLYNTITSSKQSAVEETHINFLIPVYHNKTIYSINFTLGKGGLDESTKRDMADLISAIHISILPDQSSQPSIFSDINDIKSANLGIYPDLEKIDITYSNLVNNYSGYKLSYPSIFIPYMQNNVVSSFDYKSFKINSNSYFAINVEPIKFGESNALQSKINSIVYLYKDKLKINDGSLLKLQGEKAFRLSYMLTINNEATYITDYYIICNSLFYTIQLSSSFSEAPRKIQDEFKKIVNSMQFTTPSSSKNSTLPEHAKYINSEEGYTFSYPDNWKLIENTSSDINYDTFSIVNPNFSGPIDISISEGELISPLVNPDTLKFVSATDTPEFKGYFKKYSAPYLNKTNKLLASSYYVKDDATYIFKLINYLDESDRSKICYSEDIIRNKKIYSIFIAISDYATADGKLVNKDLNSIISFISSSFDLENTDEYNQRQKRKEIRNRKIVFVENYFKLKFGQSAAISSISNLTSPGYFFVAVNGIAESGFYKISMDYSKKTVGIVDKVLKKDIFKSASEDLKSRYSRKLIKSISPNEATMTVNIVYRDNEFSPEITRTYQVSMNQDSSLNWELVRKDYSNALKSDCQVFLNNYLKAPARVYFPSQGDLLGTTNYNGQKYYSVVYAETPQLSEYFVLEIDPVDDSISVISHTPAESLYNNIKNLYTASSDEKYSVVSVGISNVDKFEIRVLIRSKQNGEFITNKIKVKYNPETHSIDLI